MSCARRFRASKENGDGGPKRSAATSLAEGGPEAANAPRAPARNERRSIMEDGGCEPEVGGARPAVNRAGLALQHRVTVRIDPDLPRRRADGAPGVVGERHAVLEALGLAAALGLARHLHLAAGARRARALEELDVALRLRRIGLVGAEERRRHVEGQHAVGEARHARSGAARAGEGAGEELAHEGEARALVLAEGADRALTVAGVGRARVVVIAVERVRIGG